MRLRRGKKLEVPTTSEVRRSVKKIAKKSGRSIQEILYYFAYVGLNKATIDRIGSLPFIEKGKRKHHRLYMRLPTRAVEYLDDLAWLHGHAPYISNNNGGGYVIGLSANWCLRTYPEKHWITFFSSGCDLQEIIEDTLWQS